MNKQGKVIDGKQVGGIGWTAIFGPGSGFTANPVRGCVHACRWKMPDGKIVKCYAQSQIERLHGPGVFEKITFHPEVFAGINNRKEPAGIFIDSMSDLFGNNVPHDHIELVLEVMRLNPQHIFFTLTKNPIRLSKFSFPENALIGLSSPPSFIYGKELSDEQQQIWFQRGMEELDACDARHVWVSLEPLAVDVVKHLRRHRDRISWAVVGAGSDGSKLYQPDADLLKRTLLELHCPVYFKENLSPELAASVGYPWRAEFPAFVKREADLFHME